MRNKYHHLFHPALKAGLFISLALIITQARAAQDEGFVKKAARDGVAEVEMAKIAEQRATDPEVKQLAQRIQQDHEKANEELKQLASQKGIRLPDAPDRTHQKISKTLSELNGSDFDKSYIKEMVKDHKKDVKEFQKEATKGKDADLKNWASQKVDTLRQHLQAAQSIQARLQSAKSTSGG
jgi:putative membrane protein